MRKIAKREKIVLSIGTLAVIGILVYFLFLPVLTGEGSKSTSGLKLKQERLELVQKLRNMDPVLTEVEKNIRSQLGYGEMSFKPGIADSIIIKYLAQVAAQSEIREIEQLDAKPEKSRKAQADQRSDQSILRSLTNRLHLCQVTDELKRPSEPKGMVRGISETSGGSIALAGEEANPEDEVTLLFPPLPRDIPDEVKRSLVKLIETSNGQMITDDDIDGIIEQSGLKEGQEAERVRKRLLLYRDRVREKKGELMGLLSKLGTLGDTKTEQKVGRFSVKMSFKSELAPLVKLLYNLQNSAKWIKINGMQVTVSDPKRSLLAVELSMTAFALYE